MQKVIQIGAINSKLAHSMSELLSRSLEGVDIVSNIKVLVSERGQQDIESLWKSLKDGSIDIAIISLSEVDLAGQKGLVIGGLSERSGPENCLITQKDCVDLACDLRIKDKSKVVTNAAVQQAQLLELNPNLTVSVGSTSHEDNIVDLQNGKYQAIIIPKYIWENYSQALSDYNILTLNPKEMIPNPGEGVTAYIMHTENIEARRALKTIHKKETSDITNIERKLSKLVYDTYTNKHQIAVYCQIDNNGYYHANACMVTEDFQFKKAMLSQSTTASLAENLFQLLNK